jgi:hypothetical protein
MAYTQLAITIDQGNAVTTIVTVSLGSLTPDEFMGTVHKVGGFWDNAHASYYTHEQIRKVTPQ